MEIPFFIIFNKLYDDYNPKNLLIWDKNNGLRQKLTNFSVSFSFEPRRESWVISKWKLRSLKSRFPFENTNDYYEISISTVLLIFSSVFTGNKNYASINWSDSEVKVYSLSFLCFGRRIVDNIHDSSYYVHFGCCVTDCTVLK